MDLQVFKFKRQVPQDCAECHHVEEAKNATVHVPGQAYVFLNCKTNYDDGECDSINGDENYDGSFQNDTEGAVVGGREGGECDFVGC